MTGTRDIKGIIFDWGGVLIHNPLPGMVKYFSEALHSPADSVATAIGRHHGAFQEGVVTERQFWSRVCTELRIPESGRESLWGDAVRSVFQPNAETIGIVKQLRKEGYRTALLSNTEFPAREIFTEHYSFLFDAAILSFEEHMVKPDVRIYLRAAERLAIEPSCAIFIDDNPAYVEGASRAGLRGIHFTDPATLRLQLKTRGIHVA